jgi:hypothetical protein
MSHPNLTGRRGAPRQDAAAWLDADHRHPRADPPRRLLAMSAPRTTRGTARGRDDRWRRNDRARHDHQARYGRQPGKARRIPGAPHPSGFAVRSVHAASIMMKTVKHSLHSFGDRSGDLAKTIGSETADLAKRFGSGTANLAKRIGPRRGLIGLAALAVVIGGSVVLIRYMRARNLEKRNLADAGDDLSGHARAGNRSSAQRSPGAHPSH